MDEGLLAAPLPRCDDDVALDPLRPGRLVLRQLAGGDTVGPLAEILERHAVELTGEAEHHPLSGLAGRDAARPCLFARFERAELGGDGPGRFLPELMAADAIDVAHLLAPSLTRDVGGDIGRAAEILGRRHLHHRVPVHRRIIMRRRALIRRRHCREIEAVAWLAAHLWRIDETVAAHPDLIIRHRQVGDDVAALVVGHHQLGKLGRQFRRLRDHPHARFRPARAPHDAADVVTIDRDRRRLLSAGWNRRGHGDRDRGHGRKQKFLDAHLVLP